MEKINAILEEWDGGCFYTNEQLVEAYREFLRTLLETPRFSEPHAIAFLKAGYEAYITELATLGRSDPYAELTYNFALCQVGGAVTTRAQSAAERPASLELPALSQAEVGPTPEVDAMEVERPASLEVMETDEPQAGPSGLKRAREEDEEVQPTIEVLDTREREIKRFKTKFREETMCIKNLGSDSLDKTELVKSLFDSILQRQKEAVGAEPHDRCMVELSSSENPDRPLWFNMRRVDQINSEVILDKLTRTIQSNENFLVDGKLHVSYIHIPTPKPGGNPGTSAYRKPLQEIDHWLDEKIKTSTIFCPQNTGDMYCLTRAVAVGMLRGSISRDALKRLKKPESQVQRQEALKLWKLAGFQDNTPCDIDAVRTLQDKMKEHRLCVFNGKTYHDLVFKGPISTKREPRKNIYLLWHNQHFYTIFSPGPAFGTNLFCEDCLVGFSNKEDHPLCESACQRCSAKEEHTSDLIKCADCSRYFAGQDCFNHHKTAKLYPGKKTACQVVKFCTGCQTLYKLEKRGKAGKNEQHVCFSYKCTYCKETVEENHDCFMQPWEPQPLNDTTRYIRMYFDLESVQSASADLSPAFREHKANYLVCQSVCDKCVHISSREHICEGCGPRQHIFHTLDQQDKSPIVQFLDYLQSLFNEKKTHITVFAHNMRSYDGILTISELISKNQKPDVILNGAKILSMTVGTNLVFKDSLCFIPQKLSQLPKSFGLTELHKGYFPYDFNTPDNYNYVGAIPDKSFYSTSCMKRKELEAFNEGYSEQVRSNVIFNFREEIEKYTVSDTCILREACERFRHLFMESAGFDPLHYNITLPSACMSNFRKNFLKPNTIGIVPEGGFRGRDKQSDIALKWLDYEQHKLGAKIITAESGREVEVLGYKADGYAEVKLDDGTIQKTVWEFWGCYFHGCIVCFKNPDRKINPGDAETRYERTLRKIKAFQNSEYNLIQKWEHEFVWELENDADTRQYFAEHPTTRTAPLKLREALFGGRTSALRSYCKADLNKGEVIKFADVVSMYPNANLREEYPCGHPTIYLEGDPNMPPLTQWNGVAKLTVLPPRDLFLPVAPMRCHKKLLFALCRSCAEEQSNSECSHEQPEQREITGTWCAPEIKVAVQEGYTIRKIHEVCQYPSTSKFDIETGVDGLFSGYIRANMADKLHASGWPANCTSEEEKKAYIQAVRQEDGVDLDPSKMEKNPGMRFLAKLKLNSFWGKMGERTLRSKTTFVNTYEELMQLVTDDTVQITGMVPHGETMLQVQYAPIEDADVSFPSSSLIHAAFTTCYGRIQLFKYLKIVGERALYFDTDSVCYLSRPGEPDLPNGQHLGQLTDQCAEDYGPGSFVTEFCAAGAKNYSYKVAVGGDTSNIKTVTKVRGISINSSCDKIVTFKNMKRLAVEGKDPITVPIPMQIARIAKWRIVTHSTSKTWRECLTKRRRVDNIHTVPYGFKPTP